MGWQRVGGPGGQQVSKGEVAVHLGQHALAVIIVIAAPRAELLLWGGLLVLACPAALALRSVPAPGFRCAPVRGQVPAWWGGPRESVT